ncbi:response regulator [Bermanella marisrubri]|uniref:CheY-like receiver protein n=1 Tax=Bermanella marisrubri TaxID=207949 RepID=Q1MZ64_9GAMM|nr:response regulator [Bermanella marisrubri]EAT11269.1 CheY-like receiver protein [Oceanobacter sp. RED65] [Bermanella marisrubri]QIZ82751.1 response regulator [Bermanella marisrubri]
MSTHSSSSQAADNKQASLNKTALVVDDSKLARYVLREMLLEHQIKVETAESAEEALGILSALKPDVIFMDHMMPGMDGFQAVQVIKSDPSTAKIPIMMYTSKDEGVYINQARALGAVGVLPKKLKPVQLEKVLRQLSLIPQKVSQTESDSASAALAKQEASRAAEQQAHIIANTQHSLDELARSASEDLEKDSMRKLFRQLFIEQRDTIKQDLHSLLREMVSQLEPTVRDLSSRNVFWHKIVLATLLFVAAAFVFFDSGEQPQDNFEPLKAVIDKQSKAISDLKDAVASTSVQNLEPNNSESLVDIRTLEWALNQNNQVGYQQTLNSPAYQNYLSEMVAQLSDQGFQGSLVIKFHDGNFCERSNAGTPSLLDSTESVLQCDTSPEYAIGQSVEFKQLDDFVRRLDDQYVAIYLSAIEMGTQYTLEDYPVPSANVTSKEWNRIAAKNRRLEYELIP